MPNYVNVMVVGFLLSSMLAQAETLKYYGSFAFYNRGSYVEIVENQGINHYGDLVIPDSIEGLPVTRIGDAAFKDQTIETVVIPDSVRFIGDDAFYRCEELTSVYLSKNLSEIGDRAFYDCEGLMQLSLPASLRIMGSAAFRYCSNLSSIPLPDGLHSMGDYVFANTAITSLEVPMSIDRIPAFAYSGTSLSEIAIPSHVVEIGEHAFSSCQQVRSLDLGTNVSRIGEYAFSGCHSLSAVVIPDNVKHLGSGSFNNCERLAGVIMEGPVPDYVGSSIFSRHNGLPNLYYHSAHSGFLAYANMPWQTYNSTPIQDWRIVDNFICVVLEEEVYLVAYTGTDSVLTIPETILDLPVTKIGTYAFF
ncbi:MAG: leucine-rich repeat protein, partial [Opitutales bacterium]